MRTFFLSQNGYGPSAFIIIIIIIIIIVVIVIVIVVLVFKNFSSFPSALRCSLQNWDATEGMI